MEYLTIARNFLPSTWPGLVLSATGLTFAGAYIASFPYSWFKWRWSEKYRLSVCWEHFKLYEHAFQSKSLREAMRARRIYTDCLRSARKSKPIYPPPI